MLKKLLILNLVLSANLNAGDEDKYASAASKILPQLQDASLNRALSQTVLRVGSYTTDFDASKTGVVAALAFALGASQQSHGIEVFEDAFTRFTPKTPVVDTWRQTRGVAVFSAFTGASITALLLKK